ncbi:MAG: mandelate racemase/muconate lactonizing enzyme family protein [Bryobacteraceae bacterium]
MLRRKFLSGLLSLPQQKIVDLEVIQVKVNHRGNWVLVRLRTDKGVTGLGEASHGFPDSKTIELVRHFFDAVRGTSPFEVEAFRAAVFPEAAKHHSEAWRSHDYTGPCAASAIEMALHDIQGKILGVPCWALFGGKLRSRIRHYANINRCVVDRSATGFAEAASRAVKDGFDAIKLASFDGMPQGDASKIAAFTEQGIECIAAVRRAIGPERQVLVDGHSNFDLTRGLELMRRMEAIKLFWLEEVTPDIAGLAEINRQAKMPTAGGEGLFRARQFYDYVRQGAVDVAMPDIKYCGGMVELRKIAAVVEAAGVQCAPHGPASPVGNMAAAHVCAGMPNFLILELGYGEVPWRRDLVTPAEVFEQGHLTVPDRPGLGIELNEKVAAQHAV